MTNSLEYAQQLDQQDKLRDFRQRFYIPVVNGKESVYFNGNSLGLQPKTAKDYINLELEDWAQLGVEGHVHARNPWMVYHEQFSGTLSKILGCLEDEVVAMGQLTVNLHLLMVSFYKPTKQRYKIICEAKAFPSDQYALESQVKFHGFDPADAIIEVTQREGEYIIHNEDILAAIEEHKDSLALVMIGGVNYYTGQVFDMQAITTAAHKVGAYAGFDLAHAAGNIPLQLHDWKVDFACWCSYKYLNSSPGGVAGIYIHQDHIANRELPRFAGWWGHDKGSRFTMGKDFNPTPTVEGWQLSNTMVLLMAAHKASLEIFEEAGFENLVEKSRELSEYLLFILDEINKGQVHNIIHIITPRNQNEKGCQVSMLMLERGKEIFNELRSHGVITDWREPNVIRIAPVPLYNSFEDIWRFGNIIATLIK
ncbi:MAG TPA: kynureninase [Segetibacter sp.]|jgi:kynureninase